MPQNFDQLRDRNSTFSFDFAFDYCAVYIVERSVFFVHAIYVHMYTKTGQLKLTYMIQLKIV